ncbi:hypothetical protein JCM10207_007257 [Rhodosporidiobolus poonsookiae]
MQSKKKPRRLQDARKQLTGLAGVQALNNTLNDAMRDKAAPFFEWLDAFCKACYSDTKESANAPAAMELDKVRRELSGLNVTPQGLLDVIKDRCPSSGAAWYQRIKTEAQAEQQASVTLITAAICAS